MARIVSRCRRADFGLRRWAAITSTLLYQQCFQCCVWMRPGSTQSARPPTIGQFLLASGGSSFGNQLPVPLQFTLGGPLRLGAYGLDQFRGDRIGYASAGWLRRVAKLPAVLGGNLFLGGWYEAGGYSLALQQTTWRQNGTIAFVAETPLGPFYARVGVPDTAQQWTGKFSFLVGRFF